MIRKVNEEWLYGRCSVNEGIFPCDFVEAALRSTDGKQQPPTSQMLTSFARYQAVAVYPFQAETSEDLTLQVCVC